MTKPWDRQPREPAAAYVRFLIFRNLGPGRSLARAYAVYRATRPNPAKSGQGDELTSSAPLEPPGSWQAEATRYDWAGRAGAWDVATLTEAGERAMVAMTRLMERLATVGLEALDTEAAKPKNIAAVIRVFESLAQCWPAGIGGGNAAPAERPGPRLAR